LLNSFNIYSHLHLWINIILHIYSLILCIFNAPHIMCPSRRATHILISLYISIYSLVLCMFISSDLIPPNRPSASLN
jgi:hypothetical protein